MCKRFVDFIRVMRLARFAVYLIILAGVLFSSSSVSLAQTASASKKPKTSMGSQEEKCQIPEGYKKKWSESEEWAWGEICAGRAADFNSYSWYMWAKDKKLIPKDLQRERLDPRDPRHDEKWEDSKRALSEDFIRIILLKEPFHKAISYQGVRIYGAYFKNGIDLEDASIEWPLAIRDSLIEWRVRMSRFETSKIVSFSGSKFRELLYMRSASIGGDLLMWRSEFNNVVLRGTKIDGQLDMRSSKFKGKLDMNSTSVEGNLLMRSYRLSAISIIRFLQRLRETEMNLSKKSMEVFEAKLKPELKRKIEEELKPELTKKHLRSTIVEFIKKLDSELQVNFMLAIIATMKMNFRSEFKDVDLSGLKVDGFLDMNGASFDGELLMTSASIQGDLLMSSHKLSPIKLVLLKVLRYIPRNFAMHEISKIEYKSEFKRVDLGQAKIVGDLVLNGSKFKDRLNLSSASISDDLLLQGVQLSQPATMSFLRIGSNLDARGATLSGLELTGARIERVLRLGGPTREEKIEWKDYKDAKKNSHKPKLTLRNANVATLQENENAWPKNLKLELDGFTYKRFETSGKVTLYERGSQWFIDWLAKGTEKQLREHKIYSPQPYQQLAGVLRNTGLASIADDLLYLNRDIQRADTNTTRFEWWRLSFLKWFYGYGYGRHSFWALFRITMILLASGLLVIYIYITVRNRKIEEHDEDIIISGLRDSLWYSVDMLLPIIELRKKHYELELETKPVRYYFHFHQIMGYLLIFFVIAGLTGLTK